MVYIKIPRSWDSSLNVGDRLDGQGSIPGRGKIFLHSIQTGSGGHPVSCPMGTRRSFARVKEARA
jgi:hypothetical protein